MARQGKCTNFGNCTKANETIEITGQLFDCPECGLPLVPITKGFNKKWLLALIPLIIFVGGGVAISGLLDDDPKCDHALKDGQCLPDKPTVVIKPSVPVVPSVPVEPIKPDTPPTLGSCTLAPIETPTKPNWYAVIEIGSKGIKPIAVKLEYNKEGKLIPKESDKLEVQNVAPRDKVRMTDVVNALCEDINSFHTKYGDIPIYLVGSSGMARAKHREQLVAAITETIHLPVDFLDAFREMSYLSKGIWVGPLPPKRHCESAVLDVGSGNIKGGYLEHCNPNIEKSPKETFVSFEIPEFGTTAFSEQVNKEVTNGITFNEVVAKIREKLEEKLDEQLHARPEFINNKKRIYLVGGAAWALNTLLCLDCLQYSERSRTHDQDEYTVIKPKDIEEFYRFVTQDSDKVCDSSVENRYIKRNLDDKSIRPLEESDIEKQQEKILDVCHVFTANNDLISAAEILRAITKKMEITENRHLFFMQNNLYTWSRQYLIEKLNNNNHTDNLHRG